MFIIVCGIMIFNCVRGLFWFLVYNWEFVLYVLKFDIYFWLYIYFFENVCKYEDDLLWFKEIEEYIVRVKY